MKLLLEHWEENIKQFVLGRTSYKHKKNITILYL